MCERIGKAIINTLIEGCAKSYMSERWRDVGTLRKWIVEGINEGEVSEGCGERDRWTGQCWCAYQMGKGGR